MADRVTDAAPQRRRYIGLDLARAGAVSRAALPWALCTLGFGVAYLIVTWPLATRFGHTTWGGPGDGWALVWQTHVRFEHGISYFSPTFTTDAAWPVGTSVASAIMLSNATLELPSFLLLALGVGDVATYNVITLLVSVASSLAMAITVFRLGCRKSVAFWAGLAYLLAPWHLEKIAIHPALASMASLPLLLLGVVEWTRRPSLRSGALVVGATALSIYTHAYYGIAAGLVLLASLPIVLIAARRAGRLRATTFDTAKLGAVLVLVPLPLAVALAHQSSLVSGLVHHPVYLNSLSLRPHLLFLPSSGNPLFGGLSRDYLDSRGLPRNDGELALYLGLLTIGLAAVAVALALRGRTPRLPVVTAAVFAAVGMILAAPATVDIPLLGVTRLPVSYVNEVFDFVSAPARFIALTLTGMVVLAAIGLEAVVRRVPGTWALVLVGAACVVSAVELPFHRHGDLHDTRPTPLVRAMEETIPPGEPVAQYPSLDTSLRPVADQLFYQLGHRHPVLNGGMPGTSGESLRELVADHLDPKTPGRLARLGYRWATYDQPQAVKAQELVGSRYPPGRTPPLPPGYEVVRRVSDGSTIMRIVAPPASISLLLLNAFYKDGWLGGTSGSLLACTDRAGIYRARFGVVSLARNRRVRIGLRELPVRGGGPYPLVTMMRLRKGCQAVPVAVLGPPADRARDVIEGNRDDRVLSINLGPGRLEFVRAS